jgi:hypothetical protein
MPQVVYKMPYEPYYVASKRVPRYSGEFAGYGNDKTGQCYEIFMSGMAFIVLPEAFVFHIPHKVIVEAEIFTYLR